MFALYEFTSFTFRVVYFLHLLFVIVGFGSSFAYPILAATAKRMEDPKQSYAISQASLDAAKKITTPVIVLSGVLGILLIPLSSVGGEMTIKFSEKWISAAFVLFVIALLISFFLHVPNIVAMNNLSKKLAAGDVTPVPGGPPAEVAEIKERGQKAALYGGVLHVLFLLLMLDMIFKPGLSWQ